MKQPVLKGVHHTARPTWKLAETVEFYRDKLGLRLVHAISAKGWGPEGHPDFLHFFFDSGQGSTNAFHSSRAASVHTAWQVDSEAALLEWKAFLEQRGVKVEMHVQHELIESIYFRDPNGYLIEIGRQIREMSALDERDAAMTLEAAIAAESEARARGVPFKSIEAVWRRKGALQSKAAA